MLHRQIDAVLLQFGLEVAHAHLRALGTGGLGFEFLDGGLQRRVGLLQFLCLCAKSVHLGLLGFEAKAHLCGNQLVECLTAFFGLGQFSEEGIDKLLTELLGELLFLLIGERAFAIDL